MTTPQYQATSERFNLAIPHNTPTNLAETLRYRLNKELSARGETHRLTQETLAGILEEIGFTTERTMSQLVITGLEPAPVYLAEAALQALCPFLKRVDTNFHTTANVMFGPLRYLVPDGGRSLPPTARHDLTPFAVFTGEDGAQWVNFYSSHRQTVARSVLRSSAVNQVPGRLPYKD